MDDVISPTCARPMNIGSPWSTQTAAFISRPHIGQGVTKAAGDALCLVKCLQSNTNDVLKALPIFSNQRRLVFIRMDINNKHY